MTVNRPLNFVLINPAVDYRRHSGEWVRRISKGFRLSLFPGLALPTVAAVAEDADPNIRAHVFDENVEAVELSEILRRFPARDTLIGLTAQTLQIIRAYELADAFRSAGYRVVLGGPHVSLCDSDEFRDHCDAVVIGEAEAVLPDLFRDYRRDELKNRYIASAFAALDNAPRPRLELMPWQKYFCPLLPVQTTRGCIHNCNFCSVRSLNGKPRLRPVHEVMAEIESQLSIPVIRRACGRNVVDVFFVDDHFCADVQRAEQFCRALIDLQKRLNVRLKWTIQTTSRTADNPELLRTLSDAGCRLAFVGFESIFSKNLKSVRKNHNHAEQYLQQIKRFREHDIGVFAAWIMGFEGETVGEREETLRFFRDEGQVELIAVNPLTPFVGTDFWKKSNADLNLRDDRHWLADNLEDRLLPLRHLEPDLFWREYWRCNRSFYNLKTLLRRLLTQPQLINRLYLKLFLTFWMNARWVQGVMSS